MTAPWPPPKRLPPGYPLPSIDSAGITIHAGAKVRIVSVASCLNGLPPEDRIQVKSYEGKVLVVREIDRYGMIWLETEVDRRGFSLRPEEVSVV